MTDSAQAAIDFVKLIHDTIKDPSLLDKAEKAHSIIKASNESLQQIQHDKEEFRKEYNATRDEFKKREQVLTDNNAKLVKDRKAHENRENDIAVRERQIEARDRLSKERESNSVIKENDAAKREAAIQKREDAILVKEKHIIDRETAVEKREDYFKNAPK